MTKYEKSVLKTGNIYFLYFIYFTTLFTLHVYPSKHTALKAVGKQSLFFLISYSLVFEMFVIILLNVRQQL